MKVSFLGDISLNDGYTALYQKGCRPFEGIRYILSGSDLVIGNLECMAAGEHGENELKFPRLKTSIETLGYIKDLNLSLATLAHNHVYDNLLDGFNRTVSFLDAHDVGWLGAGSSAEAACRPFFVSLQDITLCFLNYITEDTHPGLPDNAPLYLNFFSNEQAWADIGNCRQRADHIIVILHWGGRSEALLYPHLDQRRIAHGLIDYGADLVIGGHTHTLQPYEIYKGKYIFYSLGNFCFADIYCEGRVYPVRPGKKTESLIVTAEFSPNAYEIHMIPIVNRNLSIMIDKTVLQALKRRVFIYRCFLRHAFFWFFYAVYCMFVAPSLRFCTASDTTLPERIRGLNRKKIAAFFRKRIPL